MHTQQRKDDLPIMRHAKSSRDGVYQEFYHNSQGQRINSDAVIVEALREKYPQLHLSITPRHNCDFLDYASSGEAHAVPSDAGDELSQQALKWRCYSSPARRLDGLRGDLYDIVKFGKYFYTWKEHEYIIYVVEDEISGFTQIINYLLGSSKESTEALLEAAGQYGNELRDEVLVYDGGYWQKSRELWRSVQDSLWENVILDPEMKKAIIGVVDTFFNSREKYQKLKVPWKRGIIYYGPPGNGKTISIKAMMHTLYDRPDPIPTLYVRSLVAYGGPEAALRNIFNRAREMAPCFLVFEDLDSIITDAVRSYFLNEVDGIKSNDGILILGSTNHLDRLDPGIAKRPSRFDRKYLFPNPNLEERIQYCEFWRHKLADNESIEFPAKLNREIALITDDFSFAYIQEAFVAALLAIAGQEEQEDELVLKADQTASEDPSDLMLVDGKDDDLNRYVLWRQLKIQIKILRAELEEEEVVG